MHRTYRLTAQRVRDERGVERTVYGVKAEGDAGEPPACFPDVFFDREKAEAFVRLCNEQQPAPVHLRDVVLNALAEQYAGD